MEFKEKILKINKYSIFVILTIFFIFSFIITFFILKANLNEEIRNIKQEYISSQKNLLKNQINNVINAIESARNNIKDKKLKQLPIIALNISTLLNHNILDKNFIENIKKLFNVEIGISDLEGNRILATSKDYNKEKRLILLHKLIKSHKKENFFEFNTFKGKKYTFLKIYNNYLISVAIYQKCIDEEVKSFAKRLLYSIRFGPKNNGYISVAKILNYKGGKHFAKVVILPVNPKWEGKLLNDDKKDAKGKEYRKEYLKIANTKGEGFVSYWFFKHSSHIIRPKISYVKLYKPFNWLIFSSLFIDDIKEIIQQKEAAFKKELEEIFKYYIAAYILLMLLAFFITKYENKILREIIDNYENNNKKYQEKLKELNLKLQKEVEKKAQELIEKSFIDPLTKLPNREKLLLDLNDNYVSVINIDGFKEINDFYGIQTGDKLLKEFGEFLNKFYSKVYKLSADEFAFIAPSRAVLRRLIAKIIEELKQHSFIINNENIHLTIKAGIGKTLSEADLALKYAKSKPKDIIVYNPKLPILKEFEENLKWKKIIDKAIKEDNVIPFVQGIVNNETKEIEKYECLMRIKDNDKIYSPFLFLNIAKKTGQYEALQNIMIKKCFKKFANLNYKFSINLTTEELKNKKFFKFLLKEIENHNIANNLIIELLEDNELIEDKNIKKHMYTLKELGVEIAIDDFGSGYSNFVYLIKEIPASIVKIDGSIIKNIIEDEKSYKILKKISELLNEFNLSSVGEFVENEEIYQKIKELNIKHSQGYYFSKPIPLQDIN